ncbi:MAG: hypothetical protein KAQ71_18140 [Desulfobulbaceae bacterium]|nr:hypothetical protein [Desulfobulbaceae bacterium]
MIIKKSSTGVQDRPYTISEKVITNSISETGSKNIVTKKTKEVRKNEKPVKNQFLVLEMITAFVAVGLFLPELI